METLGAENVTHVKVWVLGFVRGRATGQVGIHADIDYCIFTHHKQDAGLSTSSKMGTPQSGRCLLISVWQCQKDPLFCGHPHIVQNTVGTVPFGAFVAHLLYPFE